MFLLQQPLLKLSCFILVSSLSSIATLGAETKPDCQSKCGNITVPYPFGIGEGCSIAPAFDINCNTSFDPPKSFLGNGNVEVVEISSTQVRIKNFVAHFCLNQSGELIPGDTESAWINLTGTPYTFSNTANKFTAIGCNSLALMEGNEAFRTGCISICDNMETVTSGSCSGVGCCQTPVPKGLKKIQTAISTAIKNSTSWKFNPCGYAFLVDQESYIFNASSLVGGLPSTTGDPSTIGDAPVVLDWAIGNQTCPEAKKDLTTYACKGNSTCQESDNGPGYLCSCKNGYEGNPYLSPGCQDINECEGPNNPCEGNCINIPGSYYCTCPHGTNGNGSTCIPEIVKFPVFKFTLGFGFGLLFLIFGSSWLYLTIKRQKLIKQRQKFFQQNGGMLLQQQIAFHEGAIESTKIFSAQELEKATDGYAENRILGRGGNGTVYKGILPENRIVAIKKSKIVDRNQIEQFINEVVILTQINHRNVVKLLGCCLETEVPLLVYEFVSNGTLYNYIHGNNMINSVSWDNRLRIATETAAALAYLHSATSTPIIHRDVKSTNILLDDNYITKVSDFGASRLIPIDQAQITTLVQGTLGYLDPEYFQSSQLTEKSDVYSFGVVLAELLTGKMPVSFDRPEAQRNLSSCFVLSMQQNCLLQILETRVMNEGNREQIIAVAELAKRCLKLKGESRPTMREVVTELEGLRNLERHPWVHVNHEETAGLLDDQKDLYPVGNSSLDLYPVGNLSVSPYNGASSVQYSGNSSSQYSAKTSMLVSLNLPR